MLLSLIKGWCYSFRHLKPDGHIICNHWADISLVPVVKKPVHQ